MKGRSFTMNRTMLLRHRRKFMRKLNMIVYSYIAIACIAISLVIGISDVVYAKEIDTDAYLVEPRPIVKEIKDVNLIIEYADGITISESELNGRSFDEAHDDVIAQREALQRAEEEAAKRALEEEMKRLAEPEMRMDIDDKTYEVLVRVTEAEVTGESFTYKGDKVSEEEMLLAKVRVAQVFMNRVEDDSKFSSVDSLYEALTQKNASSTFNDGRYYTVDITDMTKEAVDLALRADTADYTDGALFFSSNTNHCDYGSYLFTDDVGHSFFK